MQVRYRWTALQVTTVFSVVFLLLGFWSPFFFLGLLLTAPLLLLGGYDLLQKKHSLPRNFPILGRFRYLIEAFGPALHQYVVESNKDGAPFNRDLRSLIYQRSKDIEGKKPFGTELNVYASDYLWLNHSMAPKSKSQELRLDIGGPECSRPYNASIYNISAMSFGSLSGNAIMALNRGAKKGNFFHTTGEGGISRYHRMPGGDLNWQIGSGYFGCRDKAGNFDPDAFADQSADEQVKMVEIKISQGAKPGHGGILPGEKVTAEIAEARGVPIGTDCVSPAAHPAFSTPLELLEFIARLRKLSGGKPVGFKICIGHPWEFLGVCKAMLETEIYPDFIVVDGAEGGTGAAPLEFTDRIGFPLKEGLLIVHNALVGIGVRDKIRIGVSGKVVTGISIAGMAALGADFVNTARGFMFSLGCIQAQMCHSNHCPVGVATQNADLQKALDVADKSERVYHFQRNTIRALKEVIQAAGFDHPSQLEPGHIYQRQGPTEVHSYADVYHFLKPGEILAGTDNSRFKKFWDIASANSFSPDLSRTGI
ncbi:MAG: FMN-binding glutamate synthase family protein [Deltaproteobacteria bacterium]|nr:MAG: FMN-binding glutamate synthase family protein [Deltaproteobacteria bacterium]